jgi:hypothetical protein
MAGRGIFVITVDATLVVAVAGCLGVGGRWAGATMMLHDNGATRLPSIYPSTAVAIPSSSVPAGRQHHPGDGTHR